MGAKSRLMKRGEYNIVPNTAPYKVVDARGLQFSASFSSIELQHKTRTENDFF